MSHWPAWTYKAVRTDRCKYIHWMNRGVAGELDELYDLDRDPYELVNLNRSRAMAPVREKLRRELGKLVAEAIGLRRRASSSVSERAPVPVRATPHRLPPACGRRRSTHRK
jgi:arylsulfatase A-like enzyme